MFIDENFNVHALRFFKILHVNIEAIVGRREYQPYFRKKRRVKRGGQLKVTEIKNIID